jgi:hypothetical protein
MHLLIHKMVFKARSQNNILEDNTFSNIQSSEYSLSGDSSLIIREQQFDNALIAADGRQQRMS